MKKITKKLLSTIFASMLVVSFSVTSLAVDITAHVGEEEPVQSNSSEESIQSEESSLVENSLDESDNSESSLDESESSESSELSSESSDSKVTIHDQPDADTVGPVEESSKSESSIESESSVESSVESSNEENSVTDNNDESTEETQERKANELLILGLILFGFGFLIVIIVIIWGSATRKKIKNSSNSSYNEVYAAVAKANLEQGKTSAATDGSYQVFSTSEADQEMKNGFKKYDTFDTIGDIMALKKSQNTAMYDINSRFADLGLVHTNQVPKVEAKVEVKTPVAKPVETSDFKVDFDSKLTELVEKNEIKTNPDKKFDTQELLKEFLN